MHIIALCACILALILSTVEWWCCKAAVVVHRVYCDRQKEEGERKVQFGEKSPRDFGGRMGGRGGAFFFWKSELKLAASNE